MSASADAIAPITFARLSTIAPEVIAAHMSDPKVVEHMPLASGEWTSERCADFIKHKESCWDRDGLGHWAILSGADYVGWGGFQKEGEEWDFGLVLRPDRFGLGLRITRKALEFARSDERIAYVTFLLPPSRRHLKGLDRLGARCLGAIDYDGSTFLKYRLETLQAD
ncbi:GNAT family N-acetyltransferase [Roseibium sp.]|uniref:GNAT family N-acetyltransferase n=1 Tax=Roseibium sp. TaxID=1936156 RepID=UPI003A96F2AF